MRVRASVAREGDDASAKRKLPESVAQTAHAGAGTTANKQRAERDDHSRYNYSSSGGRSKLQLQCSDGRVFDVTHEEAMMSSTLWMLLQDVADKKAKTMVKQHMIPIFDVPSNSVELALFYCRCLYKQQVEGHETALHAWDESFLQLDSKTLCDLAKVASHLDIQPLVDLTCRSIAQIMSATEAAHEIRQKFGLEDSPGAMECSCELRSGMSGFDFDMFNSLDHDLSTEEYELVEFDQPSVDELVSFINGSGGSRPSSATKSGVNGSGGKNCHMHTSSALAAAEGQSENGDGGSGASKKKKNKKKKKKKATAAVSQPATQAINSSTGVTRNESQETLNRADNAKSSNNNSNSQNSSNKRRSDKEEDEEEDDDEDNDSDADADSSDESSTSKSNSSVGIPRDLQEKMRLARQNPSAIFLESQFEDEDEEMQEQIESFRLALESAHLESGNKAKPKPRVKFAPQDVFRSTLVASQQHTSQRVSAAI